MAGNTAPDRITAIPLGLDTLEELNRRVNQYGVNLEGRIDDILSRLGTIETDFDNHINPNPQLDPFRNPHSQYALWRGEWTGGYYEPHEMVRDGLWTMIANKGTTDKPAPVLAGNPAWVTDAVGGLVPIFPTFADNVVVCGNRFTWTNGGFVNGYRWYAPDDSGNFTYEVWAARGGSLSASQLVAPHSPTSTGWKIIPYTSFWGVGETIDLFVVGRAVTQPNTFTANWQTKNENSNPGEGEAIFRNNETEVRVHNTDKDGINQEANLAAIEVGATFECGGMTWTVTNITTTGSGAGGRHNFFITPAQGRPGENVQPITWTWGATDPIPYPYDAGFYSGSPYPGGGAVEGFLDDTYPADPGNFDDAWYGVDVNLEDVTLSPDWDLVAYSALA